jgi:adenylate cyclase, class 2
MNKITHEIETKILDINEKAVKEKLVSLGAEKILEDRLIVDWYGPKNLTHRGDDPWFLRIRSNSEGKHEVTWKAKSDILGTTRKHKEINFFIDEPEKLSDLFEELGIEKYAHQEKNRISFSYREWKFDIDQYPGMPAFLEIEGDSEEHVKEAIKLLNIENNRTWADGERTLIDNVYKLDWYNMNF